MEQRAHRGATAWPKAWCGEENGTSIKAVWAASQCQGHESKVES